MIKEYYKEKISWWRWLVGILLLLMGFLVFPIAFYFFRTRFDVRWLITLSVVGNLLLGIGIMCLRPSPKIPRIVRQCPNHLKPEMEIDAKVCIICGNELYPDLPKEQEIRCKTCGKELVYGSKFCRSGHPISQEQKKQLEDMAQRTGGNTGPIVTVQLPSLPSNLGQFQGDE